MNADFIDRRISELICRSLSLTQELVNLRDRIKYEEPSVEEFKPPVMFNIPVTERVGHPDPAGEPGPLGVAPEPEAEPEPEEDTRTYKAEEVRAAMAKARMNGTNVNAILTELGASHFNALPASKYPDVMARLGEL